MKAVGIAAVVSALLFAMPCGAASLRADHRASGMPGNAVNAANFSAAHAASLPRTHFRSARFHSFARLRPIVAPGAVVPWGDYYGYADAVAPAYAAYTPPAVGYPVRSATSSTPIDIQQHAEADSRGSSGAAWYYCRASNAYYPAARDCPGGWEMVAPDAGALFLSELRASAR